MLSEGEELLQAPAGSQSLLHGRLAQRDPRRRRERNAELTSFYPNVQSNRASRRACFFLLIQRYILKGSFHRI